MDLWDQVPDPGHLTGWRHDELTTLAIQSAMASNDGPLIDYLITRELARCTATGDDVGRLAMTIQHRVITGSVSRSDPARDQRESLALLSAPADAWVLATFVFMLVGGPPTTELGDRYATRATELTAAMSDPRLRASAAWISSTVLIGAGRFEEALKLTADSILKAPPIRARWQLQTNAVWALHLLGRAREAVDLARAELRLVSRPELLVVHYEFLSESLADALFSLGDWDDVDAMVRQVLASVPPTMSTGRGAVPTLLLRLAQLRADIARGRAPDDEVTRQVSQAITETWAGTAFDASLSADLALVHAHRGDLSAVRRVLAPAWTLENPTGRSDELPRVCLEAMRAETTLVPR